MSRAETPVGVRAAVASPSRSRPRRTLHPDHVGIGSGRCRRQPRPGGVVAEISDVRARRRRSVVAEDRHCMRSALRSVGSGQAVCPEAGTCPLVATSERIGERSDEAQIRALLSVRRSAGILVGLSGHRHRARGRTRFRQHIRVGSEDAGGRPTVAARAGPPLGARGCDRRAMRRRDPQGERGIPLQARARNPAPKRSAAAWHVGVGHRSQQS